MTRSRSPYYTPEEAGDRLRLSTRTVKRYVELGYLNAGELPTGQLRLYRNQVDNLIKPRKVAP